MSHQLRLRLTRPQNADRARSTTPRFAIAPPIARGAAPDCACAGDPNMLEPSATSPTRIPSLGDFSAMATHIPQRVSSAGGSGPGDALLHQLEDAALLALREVAAAPARLAHELPEPLALRRAEVPVHAAAVVVDELGGLIKGRPAHRAAAPQQSCERVRHRRADARSAAPDTVG